MGQPAAAQAAAPPIHPLQIGPAGPVPPAPAGAPTPLGPTSVHTGHDGLAWGAAGMQQPSGLGPNGLGPPPGPYGTYGNAWMSGPYQPAPPNPQHMSMGYLTGMHPGGVGGFQQPYNSGMYAGGHSHPPPQQQQPSLMGGWQTWQNPSVAAAASGSCVQVKPVCTHVQRTVQQLCSLVAFRICGTLGSMSAWLQLNSQVPGLTMEIVTDNATQTQGLTGILAGLHMTGSVREMQSAGFQNPMMPQQLQPFQQPQQQQGQQLPGMPYMDDLTSMLLAPDDAAVVAQPRHDESQPPQPHGEPSPLSEADVGDELMRLLQEDEHPASAAQPGHQPFSMGMTGPPFSGSHPSGSHPDHSSSHPAGAHKHGDHLLHPQSEFPAAGSRPHVEQQHGQCGAQQGSMQIGAGNSRQQHKASRAQGQQPDASGLAHLQPQTSGSPGPDDPGWAPRGIDALEPWERSSAPSSSFGDFINGFGLDFFSGSPGEESFDSNCSGGAILSLNCPRGSR